MDGRVTLKIRRRYMLGWLGRARIEREKFAASVNVS